MAIAYVNAGSIQRATAQTSRSPTLPASRVSGNILIAVCISKNNASHTWSGTGWAKIGNNVNSGASFTSSIGWRIVDGSEGQPTISWTGSADAAAIIYQLSGAKATQPFSNINTNAGTTSTHSATGITGSASGSWALYLDAAAANTALATPSGWTENSDVGDATVVSRFTIGNKSIGTGASGNISVTGANAAWTMRILELLIKTYSLTATAQSYAETGSAANLLRGYKLIADVRTFAETGNAATLTKVGGPVSYTLTAAVRSYTETGNASGLLWKRVLSAAARSYAETGNASGLLWKRVLSAAVRSYAETGNASGLLWKRVLSAAVRSYSESGTATGLIWKRVLSATVRSFAETGTASGLLWKRILSAAVRSYAETGNSANLLHGYKVSATVRSYAEIGSVAGLLHGYALTVSAQAFDAVGVDVVFSYAGLNSYTLSAGQCALTETGNNAGLLRGYMLSSGAQDYALDGVGVVLTYESAQNAVLMASMLAFVVSANPVSMTHQNGKQLNMRKVRAMIYNEKHKQKSVERNWFLR